MSLCVRDVMTAAPVTVRADQPVDEVAALLERHSFHHLPVVDATGALVGILTREDAFGRALGPASWLEGAERAAHLHQLRAGEIASDEVRSVTPDQPVADAAAFLLHHRVGCAPVVEGGRVVGILTQTDLVRAVADGRLRGA